MINLATIADTFLIAAGAVNLLNAIYISNFDQPKGIAILANIVSAFICFVIAMLPI